MPWCRTCDRFLAPPTVRADGTCPTCGVPVDVVAPERRRASEPAGEELPPIPWHLKLLAGSFALYLGYRAFQGIEWIAHRVNR